MESHFLKGNSNITFTDLVWGTGYKSKDAVELTESGKDAAIRHRHHFSSVEYTEIFDANLRKLYLIVEWCKIRNVKILLLTLPAYNSYYLNLDAQQLSITIDKACEIASAYENCSYLNLSRDPRFIASDFFDADHLSEIGAQKLSKYIHDKVTD